MNGTAGKLGTVAYRPTSELFDDLSTGNHPGKSMTWGNIWGTRHVSARQGES